MITGASDGIAPAWFPTRSAPPWGDLLHPVPLDAEPLRVDRFVDGPGQRTKALRTAPLVHVGAPGVSRSARSSSGILIGTTAVLLLVPVVTGLLVGHRAMVARLRSWPSWPGRRPPAPRVLPPRPCRRPRSTQRGHVGELRHGGGGAFERRTPAVRGDPARGRLNLCSRSSAGTAPKVLRPIPGPEARARVSCGA